MFDQNLGIPAGDKESLFAFRHAREVVATSLERSPRMLSIFPLLIHKNSAYSSKFRREENFTLLPRSHLASALIPLENRTDWYPPTKPTSNAGARRVAPELHCKNSIYFLREMIFSVASLPGINSSAYLKQ